MAQISRPCDGCGTPILRTGKTAPIRRYCDADCRPRCSVDGCSKPRHGLTYCSAHHTRAVRYGDPTAPLLRGKNHGPCSVVDCENPSRNSGLCVSHYSRTRVKRPKAVAATPLRVWAELDQPCVVCGQTVPRGGGRRKHCSGACQALDSAHRGQRPTELVCDFCSKAFTLTRDRTGRMQRVDTKWCPDCGRDSPEVARFRRYKVTKQQYDEAMARGCELCGALKPLHVDHDHACCPANKYSCGACVRGFICGPCNRGLGLFFDNADALDRAAAYLRRDRSMP